MRNVMFSIISPELKKRIIVGHKRTGSLNVQQEPLTPVKTSSLSKSSERLSSWHCNPVSGVWPCHDRVQVKKVVWAGTILAFQFNRDMNSNRPF